MFFNAEREQAEQFRLRAASAEQAILHQDQKIYPGPRSPGRRTPRTSSALTYDHEKLLRLSDRRRRRRRSRPKPRSDRRFPLQRFVQVDWNTPGQQPAAARGERDPPRRALGRHAPADRQAGTTSTRSRRASSSITDNPSLAHRRQPDVPRRPARRYNNSWNWNLHYRAAVSYITGSHTFKVGFNNAYGHHENTTYTIPATPYSFNFANGVPDRSPTASRRERSQVERGPRPGAVRAGPVDDRPVDAVGRHPLRLLQEQLPAAGDRGDALRAEPERRSSTEIENLSWNDITPKLGATYDLFGNGKTALKVTLNKYLEGLGTTGFGAARCPTRRIPINRLVRPRLDPHLDRRRTATSVPDCDLLNYQRQRRVRRADERGDLRHGHARHQLRPGPAEGWGKRGFNWEFTTSVQHELMPRVSLDVQYARRWYGNFRSTDDRAVGPGRLQPVHHSRRRAIRGCRTAAATR